MKDAGKFRSFSCPLCGGNDSLPVSFVDPETGKVVLRDEGYHWRLCRQCGNASPSAPPERTKLQAYWEKNRIDDSERAIDTGVWEKRMRESRIWGQRTFEFVNTHCSCGHRRFLDIGCGLGGSVAVFKENGWEARGIDPDPNTLRFHTQQGIQTTIARIEETDIPTNCDLICIAHAIYFVEAPLDFIQRVKKALPTGGYFLIVLSHLFSSLNPGRPGYAHTWYPTRKSLGFVMQQEGFECTAQASIGGSDLLLFQVSEDHQPGHGPAPFLSSLLLHRTQTLRYRTVGRIFRMLLPLARFLKKQLTAG